MNSTKENHTYMPLKSGTSSEKLSKADYIKYTDLSTHSLMIVKHARRQAFTTITIPSRSFSP